MGSDPHNVSRLNHTAVIVKREDILHDTVQKVEFNCVISAQEEIFESLNYKLYCFVVIVANNCRCL